MVFSKGRRIQEPGFLHSVSQFILNSSFEIAARERKEHKETTRAMLKYTDAVNEAFPKAVGEEPKAGELRVTCYTCHQGQREPPTKKPDGPPRTGAPAAPQGPPPRPPGL